MTDTIIRAATSADTAGFVASSSGLFAEDGGTRDAAMNVDWPREHAAASFDAGLADPAKLILVAERDGAVAGHLTGALTEPTAMRSYKTATLVSMYVAPEARDGGTGSRLVAAFREWAVQRGAQRLLVTAYAANTDAIRFYRRAGFEPFETTLAIDLL